jgi:transglutaminase-like putative cysteine protease
VSLDANSFRLVGRAALFVMLLLPALAVPGASAAASRGLLRANASGPRGTLVLGGTMTSQSTLEMTGAFSVGKVDDFTWNLPSPKSVQLDGYTEHISSMSFAFSVQPDSFADTTDELGRPVRSFHWTAPPANTVITVTETLDVTTESNLSAFHSAAPYPLSDVPSEAQPFLSQTPLTRLPDDANTIVKYLTSKKATEKGTVAAIANWVASHTQTISIGTPEVPDATTAFTTHEAGSTGFANLMVGMLRLAGIPAQVEYGWVSSQRIAVPGPNGTPASVTWPGQESDGGLRTWVNVYFPDLGWVPFAPEAEKYFVDPRHFAFFTAPDAGGPTGAALGDWSATYEVGDSPIGAPLPTGATEVVPGQGPSSTVTVTSQDAFQVTFRLVRNDVKNTTLFAR